MKNKKGFTLIELLAVILILGIIALIALPTVNGVVGQSKKKTFELTNNELVKSLSNKCNVGILQGDRLKGTYNIVNGEAVGLELDLKGQLPETGTIAFDNECNFALITTDSSNKYCALKGYNEDNVSVSDYSEETCVSEEVENANSYEKAEQTCFLYEKQSDNTIMITGYKYDNPNCPKDLIIPTYIEDKPVTALKEFAFVHPDSLILERNFFKNEDGFISADDFILGKGNILHPEGYTGYTVFAPGATVTETICFDHDSNMTTLAADYVHTADDGYHSCRLIIEGTMDNAYDFTSLNLAKAKFITKIPDGLIPSSNLTSLRLNNNITEIGASSFDSNMLASVEFPDSLIKIGDAAFGYNKLTSIDLKNVTEIGLSSFQTNLLTEVKMTKVKYLPPFSLEDNQFVEIVVPEGVEEIDYLAYGYNPAISVKLSSTVKKVGSAAFQNDYKYSDGYTKKIELNEGLLEIGNGAFYKHGATDIVIPSTVVKIDDFAFRGGVLSLKNLIIGDNVKTIGRGAFNYNVLTTINIPDSVEEIGEQAFSYGKKIKTINVGSGIKSMDSTTFKYSSGATITINRIENAITGSSWGISNPTINWIGTN